MSVLKGFDWVHHSVSVLLIEVYPRFRETYGRFLKNHGLTQLHSFTSPTGLNEVWYNPLKIEPLPKGSMHANRKRQGRWQ